MNIPTDIYQRYAYNQRLKASLRDHREEKLSPRLGLISPTAEWVPSTDTAHYSVRRYDSALGRYVYAPWDWLRTLEVFAFNVIKMSEGISPDPFADEHAATMKAARAPRASYHFFRDNVNAILQEQAFSQKCGATEDGYGAAVVLDCETRTLGYSGYMSGLGSFYNELRKHYSGRVITYSRSSFWDPIWVGAGSPSWTIEMDQWQAVYPTALQTDEAKRAILYEGWIPEFPANKMKGLGVRVGWQWSATIGNYLIPGHNMVKAAEDGNLWRRSAIPVYVAPPPLTQEEKVDILWEGHPELHPA